MNSYLTIAVFFGFVCWFCWGQMRSKSALMSVGFRYFWCLVFLASMLMSLASVIWWIFL